jgi:hypothetical protein
MRVNDEEFMVEYIDRLAHSLAQFWVAGEPVPLDERDTEVYYRVAISRLAAHRRVQLIDRLIALTKNNAMFFTEDTPMCERTARISGVIDRFEDLREARHQRLVGNCI